MDVDTTQTSVANQQGSIKLHPKISEDNLIKLGELMHTHSLTLSQCNIYIYIYIWEWGECRCNVGLIFLMYGYSFFK